MDNENIVKIGVALKWRSTFDLSKKYYQENLTTMCGCVFRCKVVQAQGKSPIQVTDDKGHIEYINSDVWDVIVDMAYYYNFCIDTNLLSQEVLAYCKKIDEEYKKQQAEIKALQNADVEHEKHMAEIDALNDEQQRELNAINDTFSCFSEGIWIDELMWSNVTLWDNNKYAITDQLREDFENEKTKVHEILDDHQKQITNLKNQHNSEQKVVNNRLDSLEERATDLEDRADSLESRTDRQQEEIDSVLGYLSCFGTGVWENSLLWNNADLWNNNKFEITDDLQSQIDGLSEKHDSDKTTFTNRLVADEEKIANLRKDLTSLTNANQSEHEEINAHLDTHDDEIKKLQSRVDVTENQLLDLIDALCCFNSGQWSDELKWSDTSLWENSNEMTDRFAEIEAEIESINQQISSLSEQIFKVKTDASAKMEEINKTFDEFRNEHETFKQEHETFRSEHAEIKESIKETQKSLAETDAVNDQQQAQIDSLLYRWSLASNGVWDNSLLWDNDSEWNNDQGAEGSPCHCPTNLEDTLQSFQDQINALQALIVAQQETIDTERARLDSIMIYFNVLSVGCWNNELLWDNDAKWSNASVREDIDNIVARVEVIDYDETTGTAIIG